jgi:hypothetical protein
MSPLIELKRTTSVFVVAFAFACFGVSPAVQAVSPAPDGGYPGGNTAEGTNALFSLTTGGFNTAVGFFSLRSDTTNGFNTAIGAGALLANTADSNTANGAGALLSNSTGFDNTAVGAFALLNNTTGFHNTATGLQALLSNTTGQANTSNGVDALAFNAAGNDNTATGFQALLNSTGDENTATGSKALLNNTTGNDNTATGFQALLNNTGSGNSAFGESALPSTTIGINNTAVGSAALSNNSTGNANTALGAGAGFHVSTASHVICVGEGIGGADVDNTTWIGNVYGVTTQNGTTAPVIVSADGQLGTVASSERSKTGIATMEKASEAILSLRPVTFHYKTDTKGTPQFGLIAEEVAKVNPALVLPDKEGKPYTVRYDAVNAMLLNEFLKEHKTVQQQGQTIARLEKQFAALTAGLQKVSAQLELNKPAPQTVLNNQ